MKRVYPVIFTKNENVILVEVPDFGILTEGKDLSDAIEMARDAIGLKGIYMEDEQMPLPKESAIYDIDVNAGTFGAKGVSIVSLVDVDFLQYRRKVDKKSVRRNVTLPNWLNREAEKAGINVSKVLQTALMEILGVK